MRYAAVRALLAIAAGIAASRFVPVAGWVGLAVAGMGLLAVQRLRGWPALLALAAGAALYAQSRAALPADPRLYEASGFRAVVVEEPAESGRARFLLRLEPPWRGHVLLWCRDSVPGLRYGALVSVRATPRPLDWPRNPGLVDYNVVLARQGVVAEVAAGQREVEVLSQGHGSWLMRAVVLPCRRHVAEVLGSVLGPEQRGLVLGLLLGERRVLSPDVRVAFADSGTVHVLAVSGLHVGIVVGTFWLLFSVLGIRGWTRFGLALAMTFGYVVLTGARPSALRAGLMAGAALLSVPLQRRVEPLASLSVAGILLLLWNPLWLHESGFQLSFVATTAIVVVLSRFPERLPFLVRWPRARWPVLAVAVTGTAFIGTGPLLLRHFGRVQMLAPIASVLVIPLVSVAIPLGFLVVLVHGLSGAVGTILAQSLDLVLGVVLWLARSFGEVKWAILETGRLSWVAVLWVYGLALLGLNWRRAWARTGFRVGLGLGLNLLVWQAALARNQTRVVFLDPGTGDAVLLEDSLGQRMLIDAGINGRRVLADYLRSRGIRRIDLAIVTHPDIDHYGGLLEVAGFCRISRVVVPTTRGSGAYADMLRGYVERGTELVVAKKGTAVEGMGFTVRFVWPEPNARLLHDRGLVSSNNVSLVAMVEHAGFRMLFTGDLDDPGLLAGQRVQADLLKSPHHGSLKGNQEALYDAVDPEYVVVMGRYPTPARLEDRLAEAGWEYVNTRRDGGCFLTFAGSKPVPHPYRTPPLLP